MMTTRTRSTRLNDSLRITNLLNNAKYTEYVDAGRVKDADNFRNFIEWLNEGSHSADMNDFKDIPSNHTITMYMKIFEDAFKITGNHGQYKSLMKTIHV